MRHHHRRTLLVASALLGLLTACGGGERTGGSGADCSLDGCTVTFDRGDGASTGVSVLGVEARLVEVRDGTVDVEVAGQQASLAVGTTTQVQGFTVGVVSVDDEQVVVSVAR